MAGYARGRDAVKVGILAIVAAVAFTALFMKMTNRGLRLSQWDVYVQIPAADGLKKRDPVFFRGVEVGEVRAIAFMAGRDVLLRLHLSQRVPLKRTAAAELVALDLFGRQSLVLRDGTREAPPLEDGDTIAAPRPVSVTGRVAELADRGEQLLSDSTVHALQRALVGLGAAGEGMATLTGRLEGMLAAQQHALARCWSGPRRSRAT